MVLSTGIMKKYELMIIVGSQVSDAERKEFIGIIKKMITDLKGDLKNVEERGKRELAFPIKKQKSGVYVLFNFSMEASNLSAFETKVRQHGAVLRHLLLVIDEVKDKKGKKGI